MLLLTSLKPRAGFHSSPSSEQGIRIQRRSGYRRQFLRCANMSRQPPLGLGWAGLQTMRNTPIIHSSVVTLSKSYRGQNLGCWGRLQVNTDGLSKCDSQYQVWIIMTRLLIVSSSCIQLLRIPSTIDRNFGSTSVPPSICHKGLVGHSRLDSIK